MSKYRILKAKHQKEYNEWSDKYAFYAYSDKQFTEGMQSLGLDPDKDLSKIFRGPGGMFYLKTGSTPLEELMARQDAEMKQARKDGGYQFYFNMFLEEMENHEFGYTQSTDTLDEVLDVLDITRRELKNNAAMKQAFIDAGRQAVKNYYAAEN